MTRSVIISFSKKDSAPCNQSVSQLVSGNYYFTYVKTAPTEQMEGLLCLPACLPA
jgi:hypothetical protein